MCAASAPEASGVETPPSKSTDVAASEAAEKIAVLNSRLSAVLFFRAWPLFSDPFALPSAVFAPLRRHYSLDLHRGNQFHQTHQIGSRGQQSEQPIHLLHSAHFHLPQNAVQLSPAKHFLDQLPFPLADRIARILPLLLAQPVQPVGIRFVLGHMRNHSALP